MNSAQPLVAVLTPVHDGAGTIAACLASVQAQDYSNWIHIVVDNASKDSTRQIAESLAALDPRVTVLSFTRLLPMLENFNRALALVPSEALYLKQLHADDTLRPGCLRAMVSAAERDPSVGVVVSQFYEASVLNPGNAPAKVVKLPGRKVAMETLLGTSNLLGTPSVQLLRMKGLVGWPSLFQAVDFPRGHPARPPHNLADKESLLATLERQDVVFLPEPLMDLGQDDRSATGFARRVGGWHPSRADLLLRCGALFMSEQALRNGVRHTVWKWVRSLAWRSLKLRVRSDPDFCLYQSLCLNDLIPRLRQSGFASEATALSYFEPGLARFAATQVSRPETAA
jgi:glycosyltransferase involved in cell wall biosynthesis